MTPEQSGTPRQNGYRMPAEWEPHEATWIAWPHNADDWPGRFQPIAWVYADIVRYLARGEDVHILVNVTPRASANSGLLKKVGTDTRSRALPSLADQPRVAAGLRANLSS